MLEIVTELLDKLEEIGYDCIATYVNAECCGELYTIDYNFTYEYRPERQFRIQVRDEKIEITKLEFKKVFITHAEFQTPDQLIETIKHCEKIDAY